jgi:phage terminase large subunit-like protein
MTIDRRRRCPVRHYAEQVLQGKIIAGKFVKLACKRHIGDLETGSKRGLVFDREAAEFAIEKMQIFPQSKGEFGGQPLVLQPWQKFIVGSLFGWKKANGLRRFKDGYIEVGKKNGKSTLIGAISDFMLIFDKEPGAEIYAVATVKDQARQVYDEAANMLRALPMAYSVRRKLQFMTNCVFYPERSSKMQPLSNDDDTTDGKNPHFVSVDEYHRHKDAKLFNVMKKSTAARLQPMVLAITTAGWDRNSPCWRQREYSASVLEGIFSEDSHFAFIASLDEGDDWEDERNWIKANPNIGVSLKPEFLREEASRAKNKPDELNDFLRFHMNVWTEQSERWIDMQHWADCAAEFDEDTMAGRDCFGALDMSTTQDITCFSLTFPPLEEKEKWRVLHWYFLPKENIRQRVERDRVPYDLWVREGWIETTDGNVVDYNYVQKRIMEICEKFVVKEIPFDRWNATQIVTNLQSEGLNMVQFGQGYASMSAPTKMLDDLIVSKKIEHNGDPVLRWMIGNVAITKDPAGNIKPDKAKSSEKIDGVVTMVMGLGRAALSAPDPQGFTASNGVFFV